MENPIVSLVEDLPREELFAVLRDILHAAASRRRPDLSLDIQRGMPVAKALGGHEALDGITGSIALVGA